MKRTRTRQNAAPQIFIPEYELVDMADIHPYDRNPRDNSDAIQSIANSIRAFGFNVPVVIDRNGELGAGHTRYEAAKLLGMTHIPAIRAEHLTDEQMAQFRIIDNKVAEIARWDMSLLADEIGALQGSGIDFTAFGFSQEEVDCLSSMVADDCLSGVTEEEDTGNARAIESRRAPAQARFVLSEFVFFIPAAAYKRWAQELRSEFDYDEKAITDELQRRLGITPYVE